MSPGNFTFTVTDSGITQTLDTEPYVFTFKIKEPPTAYQKEVSNALQYLNLFLS